MHAQGKRPVSRGEVHPEFNGSREKTSFTSGAPYHMPPVLFATVSLLSHTYSLWEPGKGGNLRDRVGMMTWGGGCLVTYNPPHPPSIISVIWPPAFPCTAHPGVLPPQPGSMWRGQTRFTSPGSLPSHIMPEKHLY